MSNQQSNILEMARGAIMEQVGVETAKIIDNILDVNTDPKKKRTLNISVDFIPSSERSQVVVIANAKSKLQPNNAIQTTMFVGVDTKTGEMLATEMTANIPGQIAFSREEEDEPKQIRMIVGDRK